MLRSAVLWIHKWMGIISGIVVLSLGITGCLYVFQEELKLLFYPQKYFLEKKHNDAPMPLSTLIAHAQAALPPSHRITRADLYPDPSRTWIFRASKTNENAFGHWNYYSYYDRVFVNPYTGAVTAVEDSKNEFFQLVLQMHLNLLLGKKYGHPIVGYATAVFVLLLISGLILWWPKRWKGKTLKRSIWIDRKAKWKRLNYDLHNVLGFYSLFIGLVIGITGLVFAFPAFEKSYVNFFNHLGTDEIKQNKPTYPLVSGPEASAMDKALYFAIKNYPTADMMSLRLRNEADKPVDIQIRLQKDKTSRFKWYYFDAVTAQIVNIKSDDNLSGGEKLRSMNYDLHVGSIGGLPTKILAFFISLFCASLPVTGYILWWQKSSKSNKKYNRRKTRHRQPA
ncbi:PepSY-associated TM helix domain-containing protein [Sphingobacterium spiritivorum]|uniref:PepSY-associated TM helix domain-containing protein n=1 Tax=Sphingobacterium spiritivorum TaxID=258 RepID=UPI003DA366A3